MVAVTIPATLCADRLGRRISTLVGGVLLTFCMFTVGSLYVNNSVHSYGIGRWVVIVLIFAFALTYSATWAIVGKVYGKSNFIYSFQCKVTRYINVISSSKRNPANANTSSSQQRSSRPIIRAFSFPYAISPPCLSSATNLHPPSAVHQLARRLHNPDLPRSFQLRSIFSLRRLFSLSGHHMRYIYA